MSMMDGLKDSTAFQRFMERVEEKMSEHLNVLKGSGDTYEIYRSQGAVNALEYVKDLPEILRLEDEAEEKKEADEGQEEDETY